MAFIDECKLYRLSGIVAPVARRVRQMLIGEVAGRRWRILGRDGITLCPGRAGLRLLEKRRRAALEPPPRSITRTIGPRV